MASPCSSSDPIDADNSIFGPWMAAVRRRSAAGPQHQHAEPDRVPSSVPQKTAPVSATEEGWQVVSKNGRRAPRGSSKTAKGPSLIPDLSHAPVLNGLDNGKKKAPALEPECPAAVPLAVKRAGPVKNLGLGLVKQVAVSPLEEFSCKVISNPFANLQSGSSDVGPPVPGVPASGPLKRARPLDNLPPRVIPKPERRKGKGKGHPVKCRVDIIPSSANLSLASGCVLLGQAEEMVTKEKCDAQSSMISHVDFNSQGLVDIEVDTDTQLMGSTLLDACDLQTDNFMAEDLGGVPTNCV